MIGYVVVALPDGAWLQWKPGRPPGWPATPAPPSGGWGPRLAQFRLKEAQYAAFAEAHGMGRDAEPSEVADRIPEILMAR